MFFTNFHFQFFGFENHFGRQRGARVRFGAQKGTKNETQMGPEIGCDFGAEKGGTTDLKTAGPRPGEGVGGGVNHSPRGSGE